MAERPILFSGPMVRAILGGTKTQTRRIIKPPPTWLHPGRCPTITAEGWQGPLDPRMWAHEGDRDDGDARRCPLGAPGDRLWVRETWQRVYERADGQRFTEANPRVQYKRKWVEYAATSDEPPPTWRPSIFMPKVLSRITLEITDLRVERLNAITVADAVAEGIERVGGLTSCTPWRNYQLKPGQHFALHHSYEVRSYESLWESINGPGSWKLNPWVWVIHFRRLEQPQKGSRRWLSP